MHAATLYTTTTAKHADEDRSLYVQAGNVGGVQRSKNVPVSGERSAIMAFEARAADRHAARLALQSLNGRRDDLHYATAAMSVHGEKSARTIEPSRRVITVTLPPNVGNGEASRPVHVIRVPSPVTDRCRSAVRQSRTASQEKDPSQSVL